MNIDAKAILPPQKAELSFAKIPIALEHITLGNHSLQLAEIGATHHRHQRPAVEVSQSRIQRMVRMQ